MITQHVDYQVYIALALVTVAAIRSATPTADLYRQVCSLLMTDGLPAAAVADAIAAHPGIVVPP
jgi:hypothetical protein